MIRKKILFQFYQWGTSEEIYHLHIHNLSGNQLCDWHHLLAMNLEKTCCKLIFVLFKIPILKSPRTISIT